MPKYIISDHRAQLQTPAQCQSVLGIGPSAEATGLYLKKQPLPFFSLVISCAQADSAVENKAVSQGSIPGACPTPARHSPAPSSAHPKLTLLWIRNAPHPKPPCLAGPAPGLPHQTPLQRAVSEIPHSAISHSFPQSLVFSLEKRLFLQRTVQQDFLNWSSGTRRSLWSW